MTISSSDLHNRVHDLSQWLQQQIIGQPHLVDRLLTALLCNGHLLVEGAPGLAKTRAIKLLAAGIEGEFQRIQFTPDLLPSDVTGTEVFHPEDSSFSFQRGPVFHNLVLADEVNRAPAKVQSALLEAMAEYQVTVGHRSYPLPELFMVMATQNPIEQEGTYPLPEAQLDRFLMQVVVDYPDIEAERRILKLVRDESVGGDDPTPVVLTQAEVFSARKAILAQHMEPVVEEFIVQLVMATRNPAALDPELASWIEYGASPRATIAIDCCARATAWLGNRDYVTPEDVHSIVPDVLRHRLIPSFVAEAAGITVNQIIERLLDRVSAP